MGVTTTFVGYLRLWARATLTGAIDTVGFVNLVLGGAFWGWNKYSPHSLEETAKAIGITASAAMSDLVWQVPFSLAAVLLGWRFVRAPFEIHLSTVAANAIATDKARTEHDEKIRAIITKRDVYKASLDGGVRQLDEMKKERDDARTESIKLTEKAYQAQVESARLSLENSALKRALEVTASQWKDLCDDFRKLPPNEVRADWHKASDGRESWGLRGDPTAVKRVEVLSKLAGAMLVKSQAVSLTLSDVVRAHDDVVWRWIEFVKETSGGLIDANHGIEQYPDGQKKIVYFGQLNAFAEKAARACIECSAVEI